MPEVLIGKVDVRQVKGRVSVPGRGDHDVTVYLEEENGVRRAYTEVSTPDGQVLEAPVTGPLLYSTELSALLGTAVRGALLQAA